MRRKKVRALIEVNRCAGLTCATDWLASANKAQMLENYKSFHPDLLKVLA